MTTETEDLPNVLAGHWETSEGLDKAREYATKTRADLALSDRTDLGLANALYLVNGEIVIQTAAKERMRWLSVQLAIALSRTQAAEKAREEAASELSSERSARIRAEARVAELLEALKPFADHPNGNGIVDDNEFRDPWLTFGDFRRARSITTGEG